MSDVSEHCPSMQGIPRTEAHHPSHAIVAVSALAVAGWLAWSFANSQIEWTFVARFLTAQVFFQAFFNTLLITGCAMVVGVAFGLAAALMRLYAHPTLEGLARLYIWVFRSIPVYLQLLLWFNLALIFPNIGWPGLWSVATVDVMTPFLSALLGLGVCQGAYTAEVVRAGLLSVDPGQSEAAMAVGMRWGQVLRHITLPQALRVIVPPLGNEVIGMLKHSSLAAVLGYGELMHVASSIYFVNNRVIEMLIVASVYYLLAVTTLNFIQAGLERRLARSSNRDGAPASSGLSS